MKVTGFFIYIFLFLTIVVSARHTDDEFKNAQPAEERGLEDKFENAQLAEERGLEDHPESREKRFLCNKVTGDRICFVPPFSLRCKCGVTQ
ncbi:hypothetical protein FO519_005845 [Halicephalobus sp. NKZ332]|nr:hypothetical protein FO519_005845 [Halicephalobus sp. NKZ332]